MGAGFIRDSLAPLHSASVGAAARLRLEPSTISLTSQWSIRWGSRQEHLHTAFLWDLGFLTSWGLVSKASILREWESRVDTTSPLLIHCEFTQCHFCHILSVKAVTESHPDSTKGRKSKLPGLRGLEQARKEHHYCCGHFGK